MCPCSDSGDRGNLVGTHTFAFVCALEGGSRWGWSIWTESESTGNGPMNLLCSQKKHHQGWQPSRRRCLSVYLAPS